MLSQDFIFDGCTILVHGFSRVVLEVLRTAAQNRKLFRIFCTGTHPYILLLGYGYLLPVGPNLPSLISISYIFLFMVHRRASR